MLGVYESLKFFRKISWVSILLFILIFMIMIYFYAREFEDYTSYLQ